MKRNRILVVEDEAIRLAIRDFLAGKDYAVIDTDTCEGATVK